MSDFKQKPSNAFRERKLQLSTPNQQGKNAALKFDLNGNYPRINVYTNDDNDPKVKEPIRATLDQPTFYLFLELLDRAASAKEPMKNTIECKNYVFPGGQRSEHPVVIARVTVGRNDSGVVYIAVTAKGRPELKFPVVPTEWNYLIDATTGEKLDQSKASIWMTKAWIRMLDGLMSTHLVVNHEPPKENQGQNRGGQGGGWNGNRGNGGGSGGGGWNNRGVSAGGNNRPRNNEASVDDFDDDIDF